MKPSWTNAPGWARWLAQDRDGTWYWFQTKPRRDDGYFFGGGDFQEASQPGEVVSENWRETLEKRPK